MACPRCEELCVKFAIRSPGELQKAIRIAQQNLQDKTLKEASENDAENQTSFAKVASGESWGDSLSYRFLCSSCSEVFLLHAETYHGSGGYWEPENLGVVRERL